MTRSVRLFGVALGLLLVPLPTVGPALAQEPDGLAVTGWILESGSNALVARNAGGLSTLSVAGVSITPDGTGVAAPSEGMTRLARAAHRQDLTAELLVSNYSNRIEDFDPRALHRLLTHADHRTRVADRLAGFVADGGWDGVNVDLERVRRSDGPELADFVQQIQDTMPAERTVSVDISAATSVRGYRDRGYVLTALRDAADVIKVMTYDYSGPTWSKAGPIGPLAWQRDALDAILGVVPPAQVDLGVAGYGYTWPRHGTGHTVTVRQARDLVRRDRATAHWRPGAGEWTARLSNGTVLWWSDGRSYSQRVDLAQEKGVHGLAVWRLGSADTLR